MSITQLLMLEFADLRSLVISCPGCHTEVIIDAGESKNGIPAKCPSCGHPYEEALRDDLSAYRKIYANWSKNSTVKLRVIKTDPK